MEKIKQVFIYSHDVEIKVFEKKYFYSATIIPSTFKSILIHQIGNTLFVKSGIGIVNAAAVTSYVINKIKPQQIINIGFAGASSRKHFKLLKSYRITECYYNDFNLQIFGYDYGTTNRSEKSYLLPECKIPIISKNTEAAKLITCCQFITKQSDLVNPNIDKNNVLIDMEGAAITEIATRYCFERLVLLKVITDFTISNDVNKQKALIYSSETASKAAVQICKLLEIIWEK